MATLLLPNAVSKGISLRFGCTLAGPAEFQPWLQQLLPGGDRSCFTVMAFSGGDSPDGAAANAAAPPCDALIGYHDSASARLSDSPAQVPAVAAAVPVYDVVTMALTGDATATAAADAASATHPRTPSERSGDASSRAAVTLPCVMVDAARFRIRSIVTNLVSNACKFTPHGGSVTVLVHVEALDSDSDGMNSLSSGWGLPGWCTASRQRQPEARATPAGRAVAAKHPARVMPEPPSTASDARTSSTASNSESSASIVALPSKLRVRIAVSDSGVGISAQDQKRLFQPFAQINVSDFALQWMSTPAYRRSATASQLP